MADSWLRRLTSSPSDDAHTLVCFPHAGGSAISFGPLAKSIGPDYEMLAVQYPGRQDRRREPLVGDIGELVDGLLPELTGLLGDSRAFSLFGHSMGSVVAFETSRRLESTMGATARVLFASGRRAPSAALPEVRIHQISDRELADHLVRSGGTPAALLEDPEFRRLILEVVRNDYRAIETYRCDADARVGSPIVALAGEADPDASLAQIQEWGAHTSESFSATTFPGGHFFIDANRAPIGELIREHCARALSK
ncbi:thioesterase II family protein [Nocardia jejuensis]|uniref:thioesterase II family protein n=1 Tax=Nocardia jejuensis TaxID=328049 RepID=UPI0008332B72|nr:alpha/beta fold hydrolase [Nocardia jejuensis]